MIDATPKTKFSGHETFFIRKGWLAKGLRAVIEKDDIFVDRANNPMDELGIGSNMVKSLRFWLQAVGLTQEPKSGRRVQHLTELGFLIAEWGCGRFSGRPRRPAPAASCGRLSYRTPCALPRRTPSASPPGTSGSTRRARRRTARRRPRASPSRGRTRP